MLSKHDISAWHYDAMMISHADIIGKMSRAAHAADAHATRRRGQARGSLFHCRDAHEFSFGAMMPPHRIVRGHSRALRCAPMLAAAALVNRVADDCCFISTASIRLSSIWRPQEAIIDARRDASTEMSQRACLHFHTFFFDMTATRMPLWFIFSFAAVDDFILPSLAAPPAAYRQAAAAPRSLPCRSSCKCFIRCDIDARAGHARAMPGYITTACCSAHTAVRAMAAAAEYRITTPTYMTF